jgi:hypothetical protein
LKNHIADALCLPRISASLPFPYSSSYCFRSDLVANRALMIRVRGGLSV